MKVKRYIGKNSYEAMMKVKEELGRDAVILHSRKIKQSGVFGIFKKPLHEVVAAIDEKESPKEEFKNIQKRDFPIIPKKEDNMDELKNKIDNIENILSNFVKKEGIEEDLDNNIYMEYYNKLIEKGICKEAVDMIMDIANKRLTFTRENEEFIVKGIENIIKEILGKNEDNKNTSKQRVIVFMGPTGVGKTTTLAKLAAKYAINDKLDMGFITADTYRIGAVEQLKVYAEILDVPVKVIYSASEVTSCLEEYKDKDLILIDTAGRNHNNSEQLEEVNEIIAMIHNPDVYLVLSNTSSFKNMVDIIDAYDFAKEYKIIMTKVDEGINYSNILNAKTYSKKNLSYITNGQSVPDDIEIINSSKIANKIVGGINE